MRIGWEGKVLPRIGVIRDTIPRKHTLNKISHMSIATQIAFNLFAPHNFAGPSFQSITVGARENPRDVPVLVHHNLIIMCRYLPYITLLESHILQPDFVVQKILCHCGGGELLLLSSGGVPPLLRLLLMRKFCTFQETLSYNGVLS